MPRASTMLPASIILGAAVIAGAVVSNNADATNTRATAQGDIGLVDIYHIIDIMILGDEYSAERIEFETSSQQRIGALQSQLQQLQSQLETMSPDDPMASQTFSQYQQLSQMLQQTNASMNQQYQALLSQQIADAYTKIHDAANTVAGEQGYTFVFATRRDTDLAQMSTLNGVTQEILSRPLVTPPSSVDLTEDVRTHLGLPTAEEAREAAQQAVLDAEAAAGTGSAGTQETNAQEQGAGDAMNSDPEENDTDE